MKSQRFIPIQTALINKPHVHLELVRGLSLTWQVYYAVGLEHIQGNMISHPSFLHTQDYHELIIHYSSGRKFFAQNRSFAAGRGEFIVFPTDTAHMGFNVEEIPFRRAYIYLNPALLEHIPDGDALAEIFTPDSPPLRRLPQEVRAPLLTRLAEFKSPPTLGEAEQMRLRAIVCELLGELAYTSESVELENSLPRLVSEALELMQRELPTLPSSRELARRLGVSESYLSRLFRDHLHTSPYRYLRSLRLIEAKRLLASGATVTDACYGAGFNDLSHFIAFFKAESGMTPSEWSRG